MAESTHLVLAMAPIRGRGRGKAKGKGKRKGKNDWELEAAPVADDHSNGELCNRKCNCTRLLPWCNGANALQCIATHGMMRLCICFALLMHADASALMCVHACRGAAEAQEEAHAGAVGATAQAQAQVRHRDNVLMLQKAACIVVSSRCNRFECAAADWTTSTARRASRGSLRRFVECDFCNIAVQKGLTLCCGHRVFEQV